MPLDKDQLIRIYVTRLANSLVPSELGDEYVQSIINEFLDTLTFNNNEESNGFSQIIENLMDKYKTKLISQTNNGWPAFQSCLESILQKKSAEQLCKYLIFLDSLQSENNHNVSGTGNNKKDSIVNDNYTENPIYNQLQSSPNRFSAQSPNMSLPYPSMTLSQTIEPYYETLPEAEILVYLPYSLLGLDSKLFTFTTENSIEIPSSINSSYSEILHKLLEAGLIYRHLKNFSNAERPKFDNPIKVAFFTSLESNLNEYVNYINHCFNNKQNSLIAIYHQVFSLILKLRALYSLTNNLNLEGYQFLAHIYKLSKFGDQRLKELCSSIYLNIATPYYKILEHWVLNGNLIDKHKDFFIGFNTDTNEFNDIIVFAKERVPNLIGSLGEDIPQKIFQTGKMLIYLLRYCKELKWVHDLNVKYSKYMVQNSKGLQFMISSKLIFLINSQYEETLKYFTLVIHEKYQFYSHLLNLKNFLLLSSNDFIEAVIEKGSGILNEPSSNLTSNQLSTILLDAIDRSSIKYCDESYKNRLDARVLDLTHGNMGWEVFTLEYKINDLPISKILDYQHSSIEYLKIFNFFFKLKHFGFLLNSNYVEFGNLKRTDLSKIWFKCTRLKRLLKSNALERISIRDREILWIMNSFKVVNLVRFQMNRFLSVLTWCMSYDVVERNFRSLVADKLFKHNDCSIHNSKNSQSHMPLMDETFLKEAGVNMPQPFGIPGNIQESEKYNCLTIDELITMHRSFLTSITSFKLLSESNVGVHSGQSFVLQIYHLLEVVFAFVKTSEEYRNLLINYISILNVEENISDGDMDDFDDDLENLERGLKRQLQRIYNELYLQNFKARYHALVLDMRSDMELREISKLFL